MALFNIQTIFNLFITLIIGVALYYYIRFKFRVLEITQREHAKVLQSVIMSMNNPRGQLHNLNEMNAGEMPGHGELSNINHDNERFKKTNHGELIDVSDDDDDDDDSDTDSSGSGSGSESESSDSGSESEEEYEEEQNDHDTKKIIIGGNIESQTIEHLTGPDIKVIELSHPLYPSQNVDNKDNDDNEDNDDDDDDVDDDEDDDDENSSENGNGDGDNTLNSHQVTSTLDGEYYLENCDNTEDKINANVGNESGNLESEEITIKTVFKTKESDTHAHNDFNGMNVQALRQLYKQKLSTEGKNMSEAAINKLTKKEIIKNLQL